METFELGDFTERTASLLREAQETFERYDLPMEELPKAHADDEETIKLVFVGQYSAGKSSIIKMLTGIDTGIGAGITTQESHTYEWNGIDIIDTPGIQTGVRPDHDEITYHEIDHAALLIFVITNEGFDQTMGEHFRKLAIEGQRGANMILVVNKMDRAAQGNTPEQQVVMRTDIERVIAPLTMDGLYTSFISTDLYEEARAETEDEEIRQELLADSGYEVFVAHLNAFVRAKKLSAHLQKPLFELEAAIKRVCCTKRERHAIDGAEELAKKRLRITREGRNRCESKLQEVALTCQSDIKAIGQTACRVIQPGASEDEIRQALETATKNVELRMKQCTQEMDRAYQETMADLGKEFEDAMRSPFAKNVIREVRALLPAGAGESAQDQTETIHVEAAFEVADDSSHARSDEKVPLDKMKKFSKEIGNAIAEQSLKNSKLMKKVAKEDGFSGFTRLMNASLKEYSGSTMHEFIKGVGRFTGKKFKPWQAVKITKGITLGGKLLGGAVVFYEIYNIITAGSKVKKAEEEASKVREDIRKQFQEASEQSYSAFMQEVQKQLAEHIDPVIAELEDNVQAYEDRKAQMAAYTEELQDLETRAQTLLQDIQAGTQA